MNPYNYALPGHLYVGHKRLRDKIIRGLHDGGSFAILGGRKSGKTSTLLQIKADLEAENPSSLIVLPRFLDIEALDTITPETLFRTIYEATTEGIEGCVWASDEAIQPYSYFLTQLDGAKEKIETRYGRQWLMVLLINELDHAAKDLPNDRFFQNLRNLLTLSKYRQRFRIVTTGVEHLARLISSGASPLNNLQICHMEPISPRDVRDLIGQGFPEGLDYEVEGELDDLTGRHPYLLQALLAKLWDSQNEEPDRPRLRQLAVEFVKERGDFQRWIDGFSEAEHAIYRCLADAPDGHLHIDEIIRSVGPQFAEQAENALTFLSYHCLIDDREPDEPRIAGTLFRDWYLRHCLGDDMSPAAAKVQQQPSKVIISYSHKDVEWLERLQVHLKPLERRGLIDRWDDTRIRTGQKWQEEIEEALASAKVAVLLISGDFLASDFVADNELPPLLEAAKDRGAHIIPINISPSLVSVETLSQFQAINGPDDPVIGMTLVKQEETFRDAARAIRELVDPY